MLLSKSFGDVAQSCGKTGFCVAVLVHICPIYAYLHTNKVYNYIIYIIYIYVIYIYIYTVLFSEGSLVSFL